MVFVHAIYLDAEEWEGARAGLSGRHVGQWKHDMSSCLRLPKGIHDMAFALAHLFRHHKGALHDS